MAVENLQDVGREGTLVGEAAVRLDGFEAAHSGDDGGDFGPGQAEAEGDLGEASFGAGDSLQVILEGGDVFDNLLLAVAAEVVIAELAGLELRVLGDAAGQAALVEGDPSDDADFVLAAAGEEVLLGSLIEDVVDDLDAVDQSGADDIQGGVRLVIVNGDADCASFAATLDLFQAAAPLVAGQPLRIPDVKLLQVDGFDVEVAKAGLGAGDDVVGREDLFDTDARLCGPGEILGRDFGRNVDSLGRFLHDLADEPFTVSLTVGQGGINEVQAQFHGSPESLHRFVIGAAKPLIAADSPGSVADLTYREAGLTQLTIVHLLQHIRLGKMAVTPRGSAHVILIVMRRLVLCGLLAASLAFAANLRLYLKDGTYHIVREFKVESDRVKYFSTERGEWEEIPLELVDLKRTDKEEKAKADALKEESSQIASEEKAEREMRREIERVPVEPGVYLLEGENLKPIPVAESKVVNNKRRNVLKAITPVPIITSRSTVELDGEHSKNMVKEDRPEFYMRLSADQRFGLIRLTPKGGVSRIVEKVDIIPVSKEIIEQQEEVETFRKQVGEGLYKIWPTKPLEPGEYAMVEYTMGKMNVQVWDFAYTGKK